MGRYAYFIVLCCILIGAQCEDTSTEESKTKADNNVDKETGICRVCICKDGKVNCKDQNLVDFFTLEEWGNLTDYKPISVDLSDNLLVNITAVADLEIEVLDLSNNKIEFIENASFRDLQEMRVLDLSHNKLTSKLSPHAFEGRFSAEEYEPLSSMRELNLAYNDFHSLHQDLFEHLPELTSLDLTGNPLTTIDHVTLIAISSLPMLRDLRLRSCQLTDIPDKFLHTPRYLERLDLSDNQLTMVPQELEETKNLVFLNLNQNPIEELDMAKEGAIGFPILKKLKELHMCNMPELKRIGAGALAGLENLVTLHLSYNPKLEEIDPKALARPDDIGETYDWPLIKELYLTSNNLSEVDRRLVSRWDLVEKLDVSNNPYLCDCSTQWMVDVLVPIVENKGTNASEKLVCQEPIEMRGYTMKHLHDIHRTMRCVDKYGNRPERDGAILLGTLIGSDGNDGDSQELDSQISDGVVNSSPDDDDDDLAEDDDIRRWVSKVMLSDHDDEKLEANDGTRRNLLTIVCIARVLLAVPIMLSLMLLWRRGYFGWLGLRGPVDVSRAFYKRAPADDNYI